MKFSILGSMLLLIITSSALAEKKSPENYWADTGMNLQYIENRQLFSQANCYEKLENFRGCVKALNILAAFNPDRLQVIAAIAAVKSNVNAQIIDSKPPQALAIVKMNSFEDKNKLSLKQKIDLEIDVNKTLNEGLAWAFYTSQSQSNLVDFTALYKNLLNRTVVFGDQNANIAGNMVSAFISEAVDPHAILQPVQEAMDDQNDASEKLIGIGVTLQTVGGSTIIAGVVEGGPAAKGGASPGDDINKVDGVNVHGMAVDEVVKKIKGEVNTRVVLTVIRDGKSVELKMIRQPVTLENVTANMISDRGNKIGYVRLRSFIDKNACDVISARISDLEKQGATGLILDLRGNPGGLLPQAVCIGSLFVGKEVIVMRKDPSDPNAVFQKDIGDRDAITSLPMITLINGGSASASEIVSGALQDYQRSLLLGERSFGKGSVQAGGTWKENPKVMIWMTVERFYQPSGRTNQIVGIDADITVPFKPDATEEERFSLREKDLYYGALTSLGEPWKQPRPGEVQMIQDCMDSTGQAKQLLRKVSKQWSLMDYQVLAAEDALACGAR